MCIIMASITKLQLLDTLFTVGKDYDQDILDINNQIDTINGNISNINNTLNNKSDITHNHDDRYYSESEIDSKLNTKANSSHTHDDRYYTESEVNNLLNNKANQSTVSSIQTTVNSLNTKYINGTQIDVLSSPKQITSHGIFKYASMDVNAINSNISSSNGKISTEDGESGDYHAFVWDFNGNNDGIVYGHILITSPRWNPIHAYLGRVWDGVFTGSLKIN